VEFKLPELGEGVSEGELVKWAVKPGDVVKHDQPLCEIMTDKATIEIPSAFEGTVATLHAKEGEIVHVGQILLKFETEAAADQAKKVPTHIEDVAPSVSTPVNQGAKPAPAASPLNIEEPTIAASPATRKMAKEAGVDLNKISASGPNGRVLREDVERYISSGARKTPAPAAAPKVPRKAMPAPAAGSEQRVPFVGLRKKIAEKMRASKDHAAHYTYVEEADATELVQLRAHAKEIGERQGVKVTYIPFVMKAMVAALKQFPMINSSLDEQAGQLVLKNYYNIGLSIQTEDGLTAPIVKSVEHKTVLELAREIENLVDRARKKQLTLEDFQGGTVTLTNAGSIGGLFATPVINYPEVAIMGFNKISRKPVVKVIDGVEKIVIRDWTYFSISLDHRVVDGGIAAEFMKIFIKYIENPGFLLLD